MVLPHSPEIFLAVLPHSPEIYSVDLPYFPEILIAELYQAKVSDLEFDNSFYFGIVKKIVYLPPL